MTPTVHLSELYQSGGNWKDNTFKEVVDRWMQRNMPCIDIGLLEREDIERWEIERPNTRFTVHEHTWTYLECEGCTERYKEVPEDGICPNCEEEANFTYENTEGFIVRDEDYVREPPVSDGDFPSLGRGVWTEEITVDDVETFLFESEDEANSAAEDLWNETDNESYGFPWANNGCYVPADFVESEDLQGAGFVVAHYTGGDGDTYRLCGIDGGGYSFDDHFVRLVVLWGERGYRSVFPTDNGDRHVTMGKVPTIMDEIAKEAE